MPWWGFVIASVVGGVFAAIVAWFACACGARADDYVEAHMQNECEHPPFMLESKVTERQEEVVCVGCGKSFGRQSRG